MYSTPYSPFRHPTTYKPLSVNIRLTLSLANTASEPYLTKYESCFFEQAFPYQQHPHSNSIFRLTPRKADRRLHHLIPNHSSTKNVSIVPKRLGWYKCDG